LESRHLCVRIVYQVVTIELDANSPR